MPVNKVPIQALSHRRPTMLIVEKLTREVARDGIELVREVPRGHGELVDQVRRALTSMVLNTTEGLHRHGGDRRNLLRIAKGSAAEAEAGLDLLAMLGLVAQERAKALMAQLDRSRGMLYSLAAK